MSDRRFDLRGFGPGGVTRRLRRTAWLRPEPGARPDRQLLAGDAFTVLDEANGEAFGRSDKDGYAGFVEADALGEAPEPTHWIAVRTTWAWAAPDFKQVPLFDLHMTARLAVTGDNGVWAEAETAAGRVYVPSAHCRTLADPAEDAVAAARRFLGTPYLWAGNTGFGIDCSGLVQVAFHAAGLACAPDSDLQAGMPGETLIMDSTLMAGDLIFWKGHVAMATGPDTMIHANAHHMMVVEEPIAPAVARIGTTDTGPVTLRLRPALTRLA